MKSCPHAGMVYAMAVRRMRILRYRLHFFELEGRLPLHQFYPVDLQAIEERSVYARELRNPSHTHAAAAAHACPIHHQRVHRCHGRYAKFPGHVTDKHHHEGTAYDVRLVNLLSSIHEHRDGFLYSALDACGAVLGDDDQFIAAGRESILPV